MHYLLVEGDRSVFVDGGKAVVIKNSEQSQLGTIWVDHIFIHCLWPTENLLLSPELKYGNFYDSAMV